MISALDSTVLLDLLTDDPRFAASSSSALRVASREGRLILSECVLAEIFPAFSGRVELDEFLQDLRIDFVPSTRESACLAGEMFQRYLSRTRVRKQSLADFLIGAHAMVLADRLVARDRGYLRDYFSRLTVVDPSKSG